MPYKTGAGELGLPVGPRGRVAGKYRISQYGDSKELPVFATDFGVIGIILCGDIYSQEIARAMALQGAEIVFCPSQSWGPSGVINRWMQETARWTTASGWPPRIFRCRTSASAVT